MSDCLQIIVLDPSKAATNRMGSTGEIPLDIPQQDVVRLYKSVQGLSDVNTFKDEAAIRFSLPYSRANDAASIEYYTPSVLNRKRNFFNVRVLMDSHPIMLTRLYVVFKSNARQQWDYELKRPEDSWQDLASTKKICTIDFGVQEISQENIVASWEMTQYAGTYDPADNDCAIFPLADYGGWVDDTVEPQNGGTPNNYKTVSNEDFRPWISLPYILKRGACEFGWTIAGVIFDATWFKSLWVYVLSKFYYQDAQSTSFKSGVVVGNNYDITSISGPETGLLPIRFIDISMDESVALPVSGGYMCGVESIIPVRSKYKFTFRAEIINTTGTDLDVTFGIGEISESDNIVFTGEVLSDYITESIEDGATKYISFELGCILNFGQKAALFIASSNADPGVSTITYDVKPGMFFRADPDNQAYTTGDLIQINKSVRCDITYLDFLKAVIGLIDGRVETDYITRTFYIHSSHAANIYGYEIPGFSIDSVTIDITEKVIQSSIDEAPVRQNKKRQTVLQFAESTDAYVNQQQPGIPPYSRTIENGNDLPEGQDKLINAVFQPTLEGYDNRLKTPAGGRAPAPYLPRLWDNTEGKRSFDIGPRIGFMFGKIKQINPNSISSADTYSGFFFNGKSQLTFPTGNSVQEFGYLTQKRTWELTPTPEVDGSVVYGKLADDLFVTFFLGLTQEGRGTELDLLMYMTASDYKNYNFRPWYQFVNNGRPVRAKMVEIRDFAGCSSYSTPVKFLVPPSETACCDLPCSCRFNTCEYYQDFGILLRQSDLDNMRVSKFLIDDVEQLTAPVEFGIINVETFAGKPYVTNLVDTLNSIAAPYFSFEYSQRISAAKGLRFFKIKWPACQGFEIEITLDGDPVYRYTHNSQESNWNGGGFGPLGYGGEEYETPENCVITIEY